jgi:hypothetical protein
VAGRELPAVLRHDPLGVVARRTLPLDRVARSRERAEVSGGTRPVTRDGGGTERRTE